MGFLRSSGCALLCAFFFSAQPTAWSESKANAKAESFPKSADSAGGVVIAHYNVQNYVEMDRYDPKTQAVLPHAPKPEASIQALVQMIVELNPDVLGITEMGSPAQFADLQRRLKNAGLDYPESEYVVAADDERHLALLSKYKIASRQSLTDVPFDLNGTRQQMRRGILDVTLQLRPDYQLRVLTAHLKSKLPVPEGEALLRRHEAQLLRKHLEAILKETPDTNLLLMGDLNDTKDEPAIKEIMGVKAQPDYMADLWLKDSVGDRWTHYWAKQDTYSRIDYILVSPALFREIDFKHSFVYRGPQWEEASDHRPVVTTLIPRNKPFAP